MQNKFKHGAKWQKHKRVPYITNMTSAVTLHEKNKSNTRCTQISPTTSHQNKYRTSVKVQVYKQIKTYRYSHSSSRTVKFWSQFW